MGSLKEGVRTKVENFQEKGSEIGENGGVKVSDATTSADTLSNLQCIDDDDRAAAENARNEARSRATSIAESEIRQPTSEVISGLGETSNEAQDYANIERDDVGKASGMVGDYSGVGSSLASSFEAAASEFEGIASSAADAANQIEASNEALAVALESAF